MDPICHTLVGAALAQTGLGRRTTFGTAALLIGVNLPDVDGLAMFIDSDMALLLRRGWTHGIPALLILPILSNGLLMMWYRLQAGYYNRPPPRPIVLLSLSFLAVVTHSSLDWLNNYGVRWLMPINGQWSYGDSVFIADPWLWLMLGGVVFLFHSHSLGSKLGWAVITILLSQMFLRVVTDLVFAKLLWFAIIILFLLLRRNTFGSEVVAARRLALVALVVAFSYTVCMISIGRYARSEVVSALSEKGIRAQKIMVAALPVTPFHRNVVVATNRHYLYGTAQLLPKFHLTLEPRKIERLNNSPVILAATASPSVKGFMNWARFPFAEVEDTDNGYTVYLLDARYQRAPTSGFGSASVFLTRTEVQAFESGQRSDQTQ